MRGKNQLEFNPVTEGKKDYCDCGCDCGKKIWKNVVNHIDQKTLKKT